MGLFKKVKEILFDEEEDFTNQIKITPEMRNEDTPLKEQKIELEKKEEVVKPIERKPEEKTPSISERELFHSDTTFPFLDFDEEEFTNQNPVVKKPERVEPVVKHNTNVFEYERKKKIEKRTDYGNYIKTETTETTERRKFKPSPIISPVYGILDKDYSKEDLIQKANTKIDVQQVRDKAFGESKTEEIPKTTFYEETETVTLIEPKEKEKKVKTIDELLEDTSDIVVDMSNDMTDELEDLLPNEEVNPIIEETQELTTPIKEVEQDTLENDLFDLIDQMYSSKEADEE